MQTRSCFFPIAVVLTLAVQVGCGGTKGGPPTVEVTGTVTMNDSPAEGATVLFSPEVGTGDGRLASQATSDAAGRFKLSTHIGGGNYKSGIVPGKYVVTVVKLENTAAKNVYTAPKNLLPPKYADPKSTPFKVDVVAGQANDFPLAVKIQ